jgi:hypothetical protein
VTLANVQPPILKPMSDFYVTDIYSSDICSIFKFSNRRPILKSMSFVKFLFRRPILKSMSFVKFSNQCPLSNSYFGVQFSNLCHLSNSQIDVQFSNLLSFLPFSNWRQMPSLTYAITLTLTNKSHIDLRNWKGRRFENALKSYRDLR